MDAGSLFVQGIQDCKLDSPSSGCNEVYFSKQGSDFENNPCCKVNKLQNLVKMMKSECENLSQIAQGGSGGKTPKNVESCQSDNNSQYLLFSTLADSIATCTYSMNALQNYIKQFFPYSTKYSTNTNLLEQTEIRSNHDVDDYGLIQVPIQDVVHALIETLPSFFTDDSQLGDELKVLARKVSLAENSCDICVCELKTVWIIIQKMFLSLSLGGSKPEINYSIDELVSCLLSTNFSCGSESDMCPLSDNNSLLSESISSIYLLPSVDESCSNRSNCDEQKSNEDFETLESKFESNENDTNLLRANMNFQRQYLKITHIESPYTSAEFCVQNEAAETKLNGKNTGENCRIPLDSSQERECVSLKDERLDVSKELFKHPLGKFGMSLDSYSRSKTSAEQQPETQRNLSSNSSKSRITDSNEEKSRRIQYILNKKIPADGKTGMHKKSSYSSSRTTSSSFTNSSNFKHGKSTSTKIRSDTVQVKMTSKGEGFGLILGVKYNSTRSSVVPVIHSIKPRSPAQRSGVLKVDDRIIAINHRNTVGLDPCELQVLKKQSFSATEIILKVEFDVVEAEPKFGTFDVILDKTLKIGLLFEDIKRGFPMFVSGIVKGSGAQRCGQLFPGDRIKFFRCIRNEEFDPVSCNYSKEENVLITVQRDPQAGLRVKSGNPTGACYFNPCLSHVDSASRRGKSPAVGTTMVHAVGGTEALVLDHEVTLFRDPVFWDFGFLVGENPDTGRAYITDVRPEGPAAESGAVKKFDRIIQVNGVPVDRNVENSVLALLSQANHKVDLLIRRHYREGSPKTI